MTVSLTENQIKILLSKNNYWEELAERENYSSAALMEIRSLFHELDPLQILLIIGQYVKDYKAQ